LLTKINATRVIHVKKADRRSPARGQTNDQAAAKGEMIGPVVRPWIEQIDDLFRLGIDARKVRTLEQIAAIARQCQSARIVNVFVAWSVLLCDYVFDMKRNERSCILGKMAILAAVTRSSSYQLSNTRIHHDDA